MSQPLINRRGPGGLNRVALMIKGDITGLIGLEANEHGVRVVTTDSLADVPYERTFPSESAGVAAFGEVVSLSESRGWKVAYVGPRLEG